MEESKQNHVVQLVIIGCGSRGHVYAKFAEIHPNWCKVIAIAEPRPIVRQEMAAKYAIPPENQFSDWKQIDAKIADAVVIATQDKMHSEPAVHFSNLGYHVLLEKPMATTEGECRRIYEALKANKTIFAIGHVLRYTPLNLKIKGIVESGVLGDIINIQHLEPVGNFHFAHSYVRGNWRKESESSFSLLAKSCHDIDWILWMMNKECVKVSSFGSLKHFTKANKPEGATDRCLSCPVEAECAYSAKKIYLDTIKRGHTGWPVKILTDSTPTEATVLEALQNGPYGRCVYECDNDVADNQVVNFCFADGSTASFTMVAFSEEICVRKTRIFGSKGELETDGRNLIKVFDFLTRKSTIHPPDAIPVDPSMDGHGGGDYRLMYSFIEAIRTKDSSKICSPEGALQSHLVVFAAEQSRRKDKVSNLSW